MPVTTPEYADLINQLTEQKKRALSTADAQAQGEAQRRGLVGQTGTSDIEMSLRGQRAAPIEQAYTGQIADTMTKLAEQEASRKWQSREQELQDQRNSAQQGRQNQWNTENRIGTQDWQDRNAAIERTWQNYLYQQQNNQLNEAQKKAAADWWKNPAGNIIGNVGTGYINEQLKQLGLS